MWGEDCGKAIFRLLCYTDSTLHWRQVGYVGDALAGCSLHLYADADLAGDASKRSRFGMHLAIRGASTYFSIKSQSKRQECVSRTTPKLRSLPQTSPSAAKDCLRSTSGA